MGMRVIAGIYRHRLLDYPSDDPSIRPTKDRIREAFFSSLGDISNLSFLDLYTGSGSMGIEAISRGASQAYFVDKSDKALNCVKKNIKSLGINNAVVIKNEDKKALEEFNKQGLKFDIIYLDPPYELGDYEGVLEFIFDNDLLSPNGLVAYESNREVKTNPLWYSKKKEYHYGEIFVTVLRK